MALTYRALVFAYRGKAKSIGIAEVVERARDIHDAFTHATALVAAALLDRIRGQRASSVQYLDELSEVGERGTIWRTNVVQEAVRTAIELGRVDLAERLLGGSPAPAPRQQYSVLSAQAALAEARGDFPTAVELYSEAAARWSSFGFVLEEGLASFGAGRCLMTLGRGAEAAAPLAAAHASFSKLGAAPLREQVDRLRKGHAAKTA